MIFDWQFQQKYADSCIAFWIKLLSVFISHAFYTIYFIYLRFKICQYIYLVELIFVFFEYWIEPTPFRSILQSSLPLILQSRNVSQHA